MSDKHNPVKETAKALGITQKELAGIRPAVLQGFLKHHKVNLESIPLTKEEGREILDKLRAYNRYETQTETELADIIQELLNGDIRIDETGKVWVIGSVADMFDDPDMKASFREQKAPQYLTKEDLDAVTPLFVKAFLKEKRWAYKELAEAIGARDGTIKNWMVKGEIPEWAKRTILLMQHIDTLQEQARYAQGESEEIKERLQDFKSLLEDI